MSLINFLAMNRAASAKLEYLTRKWLPGGQKRGSEWVTLNPRRRDSHPGSFKVNLRTVRWADFATGDSGGDAISLLAYLRDLPQAKAARLLARELGVRS